jgi:predicted Zn-dependent peptidase
MTKLINLLAIVSFLVFLHIVTAFGETDQNKSKVMVNLLPDGVSIHQLDNGLQVLLIENSGLPMTGVNVVVKTGSAYETFSTSGMSHMLEHLLFNGTETRTQKELYDAVDLIGGYNNAHTSNYYTNYMMVTPAENIKRGMEIQADMLFHSVIPTEKFEKEKGIVLEEIARSLENSDEQMERNLHSVLYAGHALSLPILGTYTTIELMTRDDVYQYYKNTYVPNNMLMSVVGNFQTDSMLVLINKIYGKEQPHLVNYPENENWLIGFDYPEGIDALKGNVYHRSYKGKMPVLQLLYALPEKWADTYFVIVEEILKTAKSKIVDELKNKYEEIEQSLSLETIQSPIKNFMKVSVVMKTKNQLNDLSADIDQTVRKMNFTLLYESVANLATKTKTEFLKNVEKPHMFGIFNANTFAVGGIESVLASYSTTGYFPAASELSKFSIKVDPIIVIQYPVEREEEIERTGFSAAKSFKDNKSGATIIAEQNPSSNLLAVHFLFKYKAQYDPVFGKDAAVILHDCIGQRLNSVENQKMSNRFGLTYKVNDNPFFPMDDIYLNPDFSYIRVEGLAEDIKGVIDYIKDQFKDFVPTEEEYQSAMAKSKRPMMGMGSSKANKLFKETYKSYIYEKEKYAQSSEPVTYDKLKEFAHVYFNPSNMIISVVSPTEPKKIFDMFQWDIAPVDSDHSIEKVPYVRSLRLASIPIKKDIKGGGERSYLFWGFVTEVEEKDKPALKALALLLSDHIIFDVREKQGRAYRMKAGIDLVRNRAMFYINLGTRPANVDPLLPQIPGFFDQIVVNSFKEFDLQKSVNMYLGRMMFRRLSSINKAYYLGYSQYFHNDIMYDVHFLSALKNVTLDEVKKAAKKYMVIKNPATVIVR